MKSAIPLCHLPIFMVYYPHRVVEFYKQDTCMSSSAFCWVFHWVSLQSWLITHGKTDTETSYFWSLIFPSLLPMAISLQWNIYTYRLKQVHEKVRYILQKIYLHFLKFSVGKASFLMSFQSISSHSVTLGLRKKNILHTNNVYSVFKNPTQPWWDN